MALSHYSKTFQMTVTKCILSDSQHWKSFFNQNPKLFRPALSTFRLQFPFIMHYSAKHSMMYQIQL